MNDFAMIWEEQHTGTRRPTPIVVADNAGVIWAHANPVELYRWISRRNALLSTIGMAVPQCSRASTRPLVG